MPVFYLNMGKYRTENAGQVHNKNSDFQIFEHDDDGNDKNILFPNVFTVAKLLDYWQLLKNFDVNAFLHR